ncbi:MAG TPA: DUF3800 domain-containing protein [Spirochaetia bacterium]|nr:DUF3800 domain-containing protein [Spirochaetia bacterium]
MQKTQDVKMYFYVDESGDPAIMARKGKNLLSTGMVSKTFMVGYVETADPHSITRSLNALRTEIGEDAYFADVPSISSTLRAFHANKDCSEVRERVFRLLRQSDIKAYVIVARKSEALFRKKFDLKTAKLYEYLVSKLFENRLHKYRYIDLYFAAMGNTVREHTMRHAIDNAVETFKEKWGRENESDIRIFVQQASQIPMLQVIDYILWTVNRAYERGDFRYYRYMKDKISLVQDIFDLEKYPRTYYTPDNPLEAIKMSPIGG